LYCVERETAHRIDAARDAAHRIDAARDAAHRIDGINRMSLIERRERERSEGGSGINPMSLTAQHRWQSGERERSEGDGRAAREMSEGGGRAGRERGVREMAERGEREE
jgi:hypothetical protein